MINDELIEITQQHINKEYVPYSVTLLLSIQKHRSTSLRVGMCLYLSSSPYSPRPSHHSSLPLLTEEAFSALMVSQGGNPKDDSYKWALDLWWDTWFPEVLKECREGI